MGEVALEGEEETLLSWLTGLCQDSFYGHHEPSALFPYSRAGSIHLGTGHGMCLLIVGLGLRLLGLSVQQQAPKQAALLAGEDWDFS